MDEYEVGQVYTFDNDPYKYKYLGGDPSDAGSWERQGASRTEQPKSFTKGEIYTFDDGTSWMYQGGDASNDRNWTRVPSFGETMAETEERKRRATGGPMGSALVPMARELAAGPSFGLTDRLPGGAESREQMAGSGLRTVGQAIPAIASGLAAAKYATGKGIPAALAVLGGEAALTSGLQAAANAPAGDRLRASRQAAMIGGPLGLLGVGAVAGSGLTGRVARGILGLSAADDARSMMAGTMLSGVPTEIRLPGGGVLKRTPRIQDFATPGGETVAEASSDAAGLLADAMRSRPRNAANANELLEATELYRAPARVDEAFAGLTGQTGATGRLRRRAALGEQRRTDVGAAYSGVRGADQSVAEALPGGGVMLDDWSRDPEIGEILQDIRASARGRRIIRDLEDGLRARRGGGPVLVDADYLDNLQQFIARREGSDASFNLTTQRKRLIDAMQRKIGGYAEARELSRELGDKTMELVTSSAKQWKTLSPDDIDFMLANEVTPKQRVHFLSSVASEVREDFDTWLAENPATAVKKLRKRTRQLEQLFGAPAVRRFMDEMRQVDGMISMARKGQESFAKGKPGGLGTWREIIATQVAYAANRMFGAAARTGIQGLMRSGVTSGRVAQEIVELGALRPQQQSLKILSEALPYMNRLRQRQMFLQGMAAGTGGEAAGEWYSGR